ncbi:hypothetical protein FBGL_02605 [Flavobacterium glycines]|uniref:Uncharacterized protein n=1 Tax=Flavobacterium glycines TaxID=551990 RepID=A0A1B9DWJ5_9FLAO|nr:hypothetical protein FBGL_02605 [Flavobacterium glycines]
MGHYHTVIEPKKGAMVLKTSCSVLKKYLRVLKNAHLRSKKRRYSTKKSPLTYLKKTIRYFFGLYIEPFWFVLGIKKAPFVQWGWK